MGRDRRCQIHNAAGRRIEKGCKAVWLDEWMRVNIGRGLGGAEDGVRPVSRRIG